MSSTTYEERKARFDEFLRNNPRVLSEIVARARRAKERGHRLGMRCFWEALRHDWSIGIWHAPDDFRLNDHFAPLLARDIDATVPDLKNYFELRGDRPEPHPEPEPLPYVTPEQEPLFGGEP